MSKILIIYSTTDGHTRAICRRLCDLVEQAGHAVVLIPVEEAEPVELNSFDKIIVGASIRYGKHSAKVYSFVKNNGKVLDTKPNAFFSVNVVARKPEKNQPNTNPYLKKFLSQITWQPKELAVFAGKIDYQRYSLLDRSMIRLIMWITKGPTHPNTNVEFTDWNTVDQFGQRICDM